ncbi:MAG: carbonic anhydrase [bacterium]|nr:carbonic anhydrase [bacterium]
MKVNRVMKSAVAAALLMTAFALMAAELGPVMDRDEALARLRDGNARFVASEPQAWNAGSERRQELAAVGQHPIACIVTCSDARVPPEILFDQSLGDLFVVRLAGNVVTPEVAASVEYAVEHLRVPVVIVLGHTHCGAMQAALEAGDRETAGPMGALLARLRRAIESVRAKGFAEAELYEAAINENARLGAEELLRSSRVVDEAAQSGRVTLLSAVYNLSDGTVQWQMQLMAAVAPAKATPPSARAEIHADETSKPPQVSAVKNEAKPQRKAAEEPDTYARRHR